ncbi:tRNA pseudouridine(38-40) synthase TruA [Pseudahrensia aquimaris]|uniref:tRNA pseudouridine synthase A n=1 Tax=Pseudahrensia aquimaris TaxID=744461 RepID=A0ABW3FF38_9HYPH
MPRYRLTVEYDGSPYRGWQRQDDVLSVQAAIEQALENIGEPGSIVQGSGRTDAGVHALGQIAHVDLQQKWTGFRLTEAVNAHLRQSGETVAILDAEIVDDEFHARFSAIQRHYIFRIISRRAPLTVERGLAWNVKVPLDIDAMNEAAQVLIGEHDFTTFRSTECQAKSPVKTLDTLRVSKRHLHGVDVIEISTTARSYLHSQVRSFAGALKLAGEGRWTAKDMRVALEARDRQACAPVAPPHGLYLVAVSY